MKFGKQKLTMIRKPSGECRARLKPSRFAKTLPERETASKGRIRVLLVDDHAAVRQAVGHFIARQSDMEIIGEASDGASALQLVSKLQPDIVVMDLAMKGMHGVEATRLIHTQCPAARVIGFSMHIAPEHARAMRQAGAIHYLSKDEPPGKLLATIRTSFLSPSTATLRAGAKV
jgi:DNA-binding NarL/FixJ family response regulator